MNSSLIVIFGMAFIFLILAMLFNGKLVSIVFHIISSFILCMVIGFFYSNVSIPSRISNNFFGMYNPFEDGKVYEIYWKNKVDGEYLFRANLINNEENKENIKEVFSYEQFLPESKYYVCINRKFYPISDSLKKNIFRLDLNCWQIRKELNLIK